MNWRRILGQKSIYDPYRLQYKGVPGNEIRIIAVTPAELKAGKMEQTKTKEIPDLEDKKCIGCSKCAKVCPTDAVTMKEVGVNEKGLSDKEATDR